MNGNVYLPETYIDLMPHQPGYTYERWPHPEQQGSTVGSMFACGNRAIYVMRNEEVVWGGILWTRSYTSGTPSLQISGISFDGYAYYRWLRRSVVFDPAVNQYIVWYAVLKQMLTDFTWQGTNGAGKNSGMVAKTVGEGTKTTYYKSGPKKGKIKTISYTPWTGLTKNNHFNANATPYLEVWPNNSPDIEMPDAGLRLYSDAAKKNEVVSQKSWRGYDMHMVGTALEEWADTETIDSLSGGKRFEYKVMCWFDSKAQRFRQRYVFGEMEYGSTKADEGRTGNNPKPTGILRPLLGRNTKDTAIGINNKLVFDFPGHIATWSLSETMDAASTRVIVSDNLDKATKHVYYAADKELLDVPGSGSGTANRGTQGWLLYDQTASHEIKTNIVSGLKKRAERLLELFSVPLAQQISELKTTTAGQRPSIRATTFQVTLYQEPTMPFPDFTLGDWATFAITDPFYGGTMYLVRRIIGYSVTVVPDQESDYSHETIELELTDDNQVELG
jgi:hypothetical protein